jgi:hypothetical protein
LAGPEPPRNAVGDIRQTWREQGRCRSIGGPPRIGQLFLVLDPRRVGGADFANRLEVLFGAILE